MNNAERYAAQGYLLLRGMIDPESCRAFGQAACDEHRRSKDRRPALAGSLAGHLNFSMGPGGRKLLAELEAADIAELLTRLAGEPLVLAQAAGNLNLPGSIHQNYHIDGAFARRSMIVNVCLTVTDEANGATELVPASHHRELSYWRFRREGWAARAIRPALAPGDVLIRPSNLWHRGTPNRSDTPRPMAAFVWTPPAFLGSYDPEAELSGPLTLSGNKFYGRFARLKEVLAVKLPWLDEGIRLGRSWLRDAR
jgi:Phytanoyl-CoA dioxygenase (PhyH)